MPSVTSMISPQNCKKVLRNPESNGFTLVLALCGLLGTQVFGDDGDNPADSLVIWDSLYVHYGVNLPEPNKNKINAMMTAMTTNLFYEDITVFSAVSNSLYDGSIGDDVQGNIETPTAIEVLWACVEVELAREDEQGVPNFEPHVERFIRKLIEEESSESGLAQVFEEVEEMKYDLYREFRSLGIPPEIIKQLDAEFDETVEFITS